MATRAGCGGIPAASERRLIALPAIDAGCPVGRSGDVRDPAVTEVDQVLGGQPPARPVIEPDRGEGRINRQSSG